MSSRILNNKTFISINNIFPEAHCTLEGETTIYIYIHGIVVETGVYMQLSK